MNRAGPATAIAIMTAVEAKAEATGGVGTRSRAAPGDTGDIPKNCTARTDTAFAVKAGQQQERKTG